MADYWDERKRRFAGEVVDRLGPFRNAVTPDGHKVGRRQGVRGGVRHSSPPPVKARRQSPPFRVGVK